MSTLPSHKKLIHELQAYLPGPGPTSDIPSPLFCTAIDRLSNYEGNDFQVLLDQALKLPLLDTAVHILSNHSNNIRHANSPHTQRSLIVYFFGRLCNHNAAYRIQLLNSYPLLPLEIYSVLQQTSPFAQMTALQLLLEWSNDKKTTSLLINAGAVELLVQMYRFHARTGTDVTEDTVDAHIHILVFIIALLANLAIYTDTDKEIITKQGGLALAAQIVREETHEDLLASSVKLLLAYLNVSPSSTPSSLRVQADNPNIPLVLDSISSFAYVMPLVQHLNPYLNNGAKLLLREWPIGKRSLAGEKINNEDLTKEELNTFIQRTKAIMDEQLSQKNHRGRTGSKLSGDGVGSGMNIPLKSKTEKIGNNEKIESTNKTSASTTCENPSCKTINNFTSDIPLSSSSMINPSSSSSTSSTSSTSPTLLVCGRCRQLSYCSKQCQTAHWKGGHKQECKQK